LAAPPLQAPAKATVKEGRAVVNGPQEKEPFGAKAIRNRAGYFSGNLRARAGKWGRIK